MNEEINIIELLKRVKEGKAPKIIEVRGIVYKYRPEWKSIETMYVDGLGDDITNYSNIDLDTKVKVLDKPKYQIITKVSDDWDYDTVSIYDLCSKVDGVIDYINNKENKDDI